MAPAKLVWVNKTAESLSLSHSTDTERLKVFSQAQRTSRLQKAKRNSEQTKKISHRKKKINGFDGTCAHVRNELDELPINKQEGQPWELSYSQHDKPKPALLFDPNWTPVERRGLNFFMQTTISKIITLKRDAVFWVEIVPCLAELYPSFKHLVVAIASTHELMFEDDANALNVFALKQCNKATELLLSSPDLGPSLLLVSCILVSAYNLLRGDLVSADRSIESGLKIPEVSSPYDPFTTGGHWDVDNVRGILKRLGKQHGFKLWAADIVFQFEKSKITGESLNVETDCVRGPFVDIAQILTSFKTILIELVAKVMRNIARGAYVDPWCPMAKEAYRQLGSFSFYWDAYYSQLRSDDLDKRMQMKQLRVGFLNSYILFHTKVVNSAEHLFDSYTTMYQQMVDLGEEIVAARHSGHPVVYIDRIVNGALFTVGLCCRDPFIRRQVVQLLQSQVVYDDGLVNWCRGMIVQMIMGVEERRLSVFAPEDIPVSRRIHLTGAHCRGEDKSVCLEYTKTIGDARSKSMEDWSDWDSKFGAELSAIDVDECLQGIMSTYTMYAKADLSRAPSGYVIPMYYRGRPIHIFWEEGRRPSTSPEPDTPENGTNEV